MNDLNILIFDILFHNYPSRLRIAGDIKSSPPGQNGRHFANDSFRCIFVNEKFCILIKIEVYS